MNIIGISLGNICDSAEWGVNNGIRKRKDEGYNTCPFDLMVSNYKGIINCIREDFCNFCNTQYIQLSSHGVHNIYYSFGFNHESPDHANMYLHENWPEGKYHFTNNNFLHFIERYNQRIQNFRNYLNDPNNYIKFIIQFKYDTNPNDNCSELRNVLSEKYLHLKYEIIII